MKKQTKLLAVLSTAVFMAAATPNLYTFAQSTGWVEDGGHWYYYDNDGYSVTDSWKKKGNDWFYLDAEGRTAYDQQIDEFYVDAEGRMITNQWISVANEDEWDTPDSPEYFWYYYGKDGKLVTNKWLNLNDSWYYLNEEGRMHTGRFEQDGAVYYFDDATGIMKTGWAEFEEDSDDPDASTYWSYFNSNGQMVMNQVRKKIDNKLYTFVNGKMQTGLKVITLENEEIANFYFGNDGVMKTGKQTIYNEELDQNETWFFYTDGSRKGQGFHGIRDNAIYSYGLRQDADADLRYAAVKSGDTEYLVNTSGAIQKAASSTKSTEKPDLGTGYKDIKDANGTVWTVDTAGRIQR